MSFYKGWVYHIKNKIKIWFLPKKEIEGKPFCSNVRIHNLKNACITAMKSLDIQMEANNSFPPKELLCVGEVEFIYKRKKKFSDTIKNIFVR